MKFINFFVIIFVFLSSNVQKGLGEDIKAESLKQGDYVGVKEYPSTVKFGWVVTDGVSPFTGLKILKVYKLADSDYRANVECIYGGKIPNWLYALGRLNERPHTPRRYSKAGNLIKGDFIGVVFCAGTIRYGFVETKFVSPFPEKKIIEVYSSVGNDYKANVEKYYGEIVPDYVQIIINNK
ncbi:uncharacterized protein LOC126846356 [Adelges cooleyi]|uniref:uncharacterized protein LOC126846356 n=1 Tax=Adelges cooleyi TaxID=133065 RepID=UPI00217FD75D|nr:uncharacterized protein LOC126846356 [Adelges cooleyi]